MKAVFASVALATMLGVPVAADAQWRAPSRPAGRTGVEAPPPKPTVVVAGPVGVPVGVPVVTHAPVVYPVARVIIPGLLMSDGSIWANFGFGYEPISRACAPVAVAPGTRVVAANGRVLSQSPNYAQPAPAQATASQQNLPSVQAQQRQLSDAARSACYSRDQNGRVFVYR